MGMLLLRKAMQVAHQRGINSHTQELEALNLLGRAISYTAVPMLLLQLEWLCHAPVQLPITKIMKGLLQRFLQSIDKQLVASIKLLQVPLLYVNRFLMGGNSPPQNPLPAAAQLHQALRQSTTPAEASPVMALQSLLSRATWPMQVDTLVFDAIKLVVKPPYDYSRPQAALAVSSVMVMCGLSSQLFGGSLWQAMLPGWLETEEQAVSVALCVVSAAAQLSLGNEPVDIKVAAEMNSFQALSKLMLQLLVRGPNESVALDTVAIHFFGFIGRVSTKWLVRVAIAVGQTDLRRALLRHGARCRGLIAMCHDMADTTQRREYLEDVFSKNQN